MESVGALGRPSGVSSNLLSLPAPYPWDEDEESLGLEGIKPKSSPIPRRRSSSSSDDFLPPASSSRRVSFADAFGLSLVSVKQFDAWGVSAPSGPLETDLNEDKEYYMVPLFTLSQTDEELALRVQEQKLELESLELLSGTTTLKGIIRVLNVCFDKMVYVRTSLDSWRSHFDLLAEYVPGSNSGDTDCFSFKLTLVPPFREEGVRIDFCLKYDTSVGTFWANNNGNNYSLLCCEKMKEKLQNESENRRKSCLKITSTNVSASTVAAANAEEIPDINPNSGKATDSKSLNENTEKLEKESKELVEEISRNRSRRDRRKAARLAKVKEHFAKREKENNQGTKTKESECTADTSMQEHAPVLEKTPYSLLSQQATRPPTRNQTPAESLKSEECSGDSSDINSQVLAQHEEDTMMNSKINLPTSHTDLSLEDSISCDELPASSESEVLEDIQLNDDHTDQKVSTGQTLPVCQNSDMPICKNVERAWENFEKGAIKNLALSSKIHEDLDISDGKPKDDARLKTTDTEHQPFSHGFTFGTIIAPLYHQVFKNMETAKKDLITKSLHVGRMQDEASETTDVWPESCISTKQTVHDNIIGTCKESTEQNSPAHQLSPDSTKNYLSEETKAEDFHRHNDCTGGIKEDPTDITFTEITMLKVTSTQPDPLLGEILLPCPPFLTEHVLQDDPHHNLCLFPLQGSEHLLVINQTIELGMNLPEQIQPSSPTSDSTASLSLDDQISCIETEMSQNQEDTVNIQINGVDDIYLKSPDDSTMLQNSGMTLDSSDDKLEPDSFQMRSNTESLEELAHLPIETGHLLETNQTIELGMNNLPEKIQPSSPTSDSITLLSLDDQISFIETKMSQIHEDIQINGVQSMVVVEPDSCEMRSNTGSLEELVHLPIETEQYTEIENTDMNMSHNLENCQMNEKQEQMLMGFSTKTSVKDSSSIIDEDHNQIVIREVEENHKTLDEGLEEEDAGSGNQIKQMKNQKQDGQEGGEENIKDKRGIKSTEDELKYIDDDEDLDAMETEREKKQEENADDLLSLERDSEEQKKIISTCDVKSLPQQNKKKTESLVEVEDWEKHDETATSWQESSQKSDTELSGSIQAMEKDWDLTEVIDNECCESETTDDVNKMLKKVESTQDSIYRDPENAEDNTSTESQIDDEMELYLNSLRNSQQSFFREGPMMSGSYGKRPSVSRGRPLAMPSISESAYEDQPNNLIEDLANMELERATLPLVGGSEHVIGQNVLWWKEFLSYDNMSRVIGYTFLLIVFLVAAYYYDFIACFALYLLTLYWLFCQGEGESLKNSNKGERRPQ